MQNISKQSRNELIEAVRERYRLATKLEKGRILKEFTAVSGFHRKHAIRVSRAMKEESEKAERVGNRIYDGAVQQALIVLWEAAGRICGKRLKVPIPSFPRSFIRKRGV